MNEEIPNLDKLRQLCDELGNRDLQLKVNASALWEVLEVVATVKTRLSKIKTKDSAVQKEIKECSLKLEEVSCTLKKKGCKKVVSHG